MFLLIYTDESTHPSPILIVYGRTDLITAQLYGLPVRIQLLAQLLYRVM